MAAHYVDEMYTVCCCLRTQKARTVELLLGFIHAKVRRSFLTAEMARDVTLGP